MGTEMVHNKRREREPEGHETQVSSSRKGNEQSKGTGCSKKKGDQKMILTKQQLKESQLIRKRIRTNDCKIERILHDNEYLYSKLVHILFPKK